MNEIITAAEAARLEQAEQVIAEGLQTFVEVGQALTAIRDERLYRAEHGTFEQYCRERWAIDRTRAQNFITAARTVLEISNTRPDLPAPATESHARELAKVPEPERAEVWERVVMETEGKPTAKAIRETATGGRDPGRQVPTPRIDPFKIDDRTTIVEFAHEPPTPEEAARIAESRAEHAAAAPDKDLARRQRVATDLIDRHVYNLSLIHQSAEVANYVDRLSGNPITHAMIDRAEEALRHIRKTLEEKGML